jgi:dihydrofolate reductase
MVQTLLAHDLIDAFWLKIHPLTLGSGIKLFGNGTIPAHYTVTKNETTPTGVLMLNLERTRK